MSRRAKIVCTLGPATSSQEQITALIGAGMDVARLNMSHGTQAGHLEVYRRVRAGSDATGRSVGILADLQGPKIRLGEFRKYNLAHRGRPLDSAAAVRWRPWRLMRSTAW